MAVPLYQRIAAERMTQAAHVIRDPTASPLERSQAAKVLRSQTVRSAAQQVRPSARTQAERRRARAPSRNRSKELKHGKDLQRNLTKNRMKKVRMQAIRAEATEERARRILKARATRQSHITVFKTDRVYASWMTPEVAHRGVVGMANKLVREGSIDQETYDKILKMDPENIRQLLAEEDLTAEYYYQYDSNGHGHSDAGDYLVAHYEARYGAIA